MKRSARPTVAIVGLGLIGGSLARALTRAGWRVIGVDRPRVVRRARRAGAVAGTASLERASRVAEVFVLAAPPAGNRRLLRHLARLGGRDRVITDVGSVKVPICREARRLGLRGFVGGHPMAGSERSGFGASSADLFSGRPWVLTPPRRDDPAVRLVQALVRAAGARPVTLPAGVHDRIMAFLSHLPQLLAWALHDATRRDRVAGRHLDLAGPGFRDMTRLAASPRPLWREILQENRTAVTRAVAGLRHTLRLRPPERLPRRHRKR